MKKLMTILLTVFLLCTTAYAEGIDWASMTDEEIQAIIDAGQEELHSRKGSEGESDADTKIILDYDGLTVTVTDIHVESDWMYTDGALVVDVVIDNGSNRNYGANGTTVSINGWQVDSLAYFEVKAGKKMKDSFKFNLADAEISTLEEVESIEFVFTVFDDDYNYIEQEPTRIDL